MTAGRLFDEENRGDRAHKGDLAGNLEGELDRGLHARLRRPRVPRPRQTSSSPRVRAARARRQRRRSPGEGRAQVLARIGSRRPPRTDRDDEIRRSDLERDLRGLRRRAVGVPGAPRLLEDALEISRPTRGTRRGKNLRAAAHLYVPAAHRVWVAFAHGKAVKSLTPTVGVALKI